MQLLVAERGPLVFVFNFSPFNDYADYKVRAQHIFMSLAWLDVSVCVMSRQHKVACPQYLHSKAGIQKVSSRIGLYCINSPTSVIKGNRLSHAP